MARTRPPYTPEFRAEAVRLARTAGQPPAQIARDLGCCTETLKSWMRQAAIDEGKAEGLTSDEREELRRLRREDRVLREERETLKKTDYRRVPKRSRQTRVYPRPYEAKPQEHYREVA